MWAAAARTGGAAGTDGGDFFLARKLARAAEEAAESGKPLEQVCHERFGSLDHLPRLRRIAEEGEGGGGGGKGGGKGGKGKLPPHLAAIAARQREFGGPLRRRGAADDPRLPGDAPGGGRGG